MAVRASELLLIVRAQNQASGALRRIGNDVRGLGRMQELQMRRNQQLINQATLMRQRQMQLRRIEDLQSGPRAIAQQQRGLALAKARDALDARRSMLLTRQARVSDLLSTAGARLTTARNAGLRLQEQEIRLIQKAEAAEKALAEAQRTRRSVSARQGRGTLSDPSLAVAARENVVAHEEALRRVNADLEHNARLQAAAASAEARHVGQIERLPARYNQYGRALKDTAKEAEALDLRQKRLSATSHAYAQRLAEEQAGLALTQQRLALNAQRVGEINNQIRQQRWEPIAAGGRVIQHTARIVQMFGLVTTAALGYAAHAAANFQTSVSLAATQTRSIGGTFQETARHSTILQKAIIGLMQKFPASAEEMSAAAYDIYSSLNVTLPGGVKLLKLFNQAAVAGQTSLQEVSGAAITVMNDFRIKVPQMGKAFQTMFAAVRFGRMTFGEFVAMMPQLSPAFSAAGFGLNEMAKAAAFMTRVMPNTRMAATSLARLTEMFSRRDFIAGAKKMGASITDVHNRLLPLPQIIDRLAKKFPTLTSAIKSGRGDVQLQNFFKDVTALGSGKAGTTGTIQGRRAFTFFVTQAKLAHQVYGQVARDQGEFTNALKAMEKTTGVTWAVFLNRLKAIALEVGTAVLPVFAKLSGYLQRVLDWWHKLDPATRNQISQWAAYSGIIALVGSGVLWLVGGFVRLFATLGKSGAMFTRSFGIFAVAAVAVELLTGHVHSLSDAIDALMSTFTSHGWVGWAAYFTVAAVGALKLVGALNKVRDAAIVAGAAEGSGGLVAGLGSTIGFLARTAQVARFGGIRTLFSGLAGSAAMISGSIATAGAGLAAGAIFALLWKQRMDDARKAAEETANAVRSAASPSRAANRLGGLGDAARTAARAQLEVNAINKQIREARKGGQKDQLAQLYLDRADALDTLDAANAKVNRSFTGMSDSLNRQARIMSNINQKTNQLHAAQRELANIMAHMDAGGAGAAAAQKVQDRIKQLTSDIAVLRVGANRTATALGTNFTAAIQSFSRAKLIPKVNTQQIRRLFMTSLNLGRMLTLPELTAIIHAKFNPSELRRLPGAVQNAVRRANVQVGLQLKEATAGKKIFAAVNRIGKRIEIGLGIKPPVAQANRAKTSVRNILKTPINQPVHVGPVHPNAAAVGAQIAAGISAGVIAGTPGITSAVVSAVDQAVAAGKAAAESHSPSRRFAREIGKPIGQGIAVGILQAKGDIQKSMYLTLDLMQGAILSNIDTTTKKATKLQIERAVHTVDLAKAALERKHGNTATNKQRLKIAEDSLAQLRGKGPDRITPGKITADLRSQLRDLRTFNNAMATLTRRGAPKALIAQLGELGISGAHNIAKLANMTKPQLRKYINLWKQANKEVAKSAHFTQADVTSALKSMTDDAAQNMLGMWNDMKSTNVSNFGDLFAGLEDKVGDSFKSAMDDYQSALTDYQSALDDYNKQRLDLQNQISDLNTQIATAWTDALTAARESVRQTFGDLFSGSFLSSADIQTKLDWNEALGFNDLQRDLQAQVDKFDHWRATLGQLAGKVPAELAKQLEALGPDASDKLDILNNATADQLSQYVGLWQQSQQDIESVAVQQASSSQDYINTVNGLVSQIDDLKKQILALSSPTAPIAPNALTGQDVVNSLNDQIAAFGEYQRTLQELTNRGLPLRLIQQLQQMGPAAEPYLKALVSLTDAQLLGPGGFVDKWNTANDMITTATNTMMNTQLQIWYEYGALAAAQLMAGVGSEQGPLLAYFTNLFKSLLTGQTPAFSPPSTDTDTSDALSRYLNNVLNTSQNTYNYDMTVIAHQDESLDTTLQRATFRLNNRTPV